jgi:seryl-tRNA synthetase
MHDIKWIRENPADFDAAMARRALAAQSASIIAFDQLRRHNVGLLETQQSQRNRQARLIAEAKRRGEDTIEGEQSDPALKEAILRYEELVNHYDEEIKNLVCRLPNTLDEDVPEGRDESENKVVYERGEKRKFSFDPKQHFDIGEQLGQMDFKTAARIAGPRFTILSNELARLERALGQFMLDVHTLEHGYFEMSVPLLVKEAALFGTGQLPKFKDDLFETTDGRWLIPTSEVSLTNIAAQDVFLSNKLPLRLTALTPCFRSEAGSAGRDVRGMLRQHQFIKVEMVSITHPDASAEEHERMTRCAESILERLELPYRRMLLCAGDTGFSAAKTYDLEVWLPGQGQYREISSCSNTRAFQARRMNARFREKDGKTLGFVHTLNGSGVAVGRALIAVLENYQNEDGSINIPEVLKPYMGNITKISVS